MKRPTKTRKPRLTAEQKAFDSDVRLETLEALTDNLVKAVADLQVETRKMGGAIASNHAESHGAAQYLDGRIDAMKTADDTPPTAADLMATEDSLIGGWMAQQADEGKTTVDLSIVEHIRTGIRLALIG